MAVNLKKADGTEAPKISLVKDNGSNLQKVTMGLAWDPAEKKGWFSSGPAEIDLDASCVLFDNAGSVVGEVSFKSLVYGNGAIKHNGDNRTGKGDGDDETIDINLGQMPSQVKSIVFTVNSYTGQNFESVKNASCRVLDGDTKKALGTIDLSCSGSHTAMIMSKLVRQGDGWEFVSIGEKAMGRTSTDLRTVCAQYL